MISTSPAYQTAIIQGSRSSQTVINFGVFDVTAKTDATLTVNSSQPFTSIDSIKGDIRDQDYNLGTFEENQFSLDGSYYLLPDDANPNDDILGWYSAFISTSTGAFAGKFQPFITITFSENHSSTGIGLFFGSEDYCTSFDIFWYQGSTQLAFVQIRDNDQQDCNIPQAVENYNKITIRIWNTRKPFRYARLMEVAFGLEAVFDNDKLLAASVIEEVDPSGSSLSLNTLKFTVSNEDQSFNMLNPSGIYAFLQRRQKITVKSGILLADGEYEYVPMGVFYLSNWKNPDGLQASLEGTDVIGVLDKTTYRASPYWVNEPVENVLRHILDDAGQFSMTITDLAAAETVSGYIPVKSHREALADVLVASRNTMRVDRSGILNVIKLDYSTPVANVDYETIIGSPTIEQKQLVTSVEAKEFTYVLSSEVTELTYVDLNISSTQTISIDYGKAAANVSVTVTGATVVGSPVYSALSVTLTITGSGAVHISVNGNEYIETSNTVNVSTTIPAGESPQIATVEENKLITSGKGTAIAQQLLDYLQRRIKQSFQYWSNPAIQSGDCVSVQTVFAQDYDGIVEKQEFTIVPNLVAKVEVTG